VIMASMGILLADQSSELLSKPYFWVKMSFLTLVLIHAVIFRHRSITIPNGWSLAGTTHAREGRRRNLAYPLDRRTLRGKADRLLRKPGR